MILPIYVADRTFWSDQDDVLESWVEASFDPIPTRSEALPSGSRCDWTDGDRPLLWVRTPELTKIEIVLRYSPEPPCNVRDYATAVICTHSTEMDAEAVLQTAACRVGNFRIVPSLSEIPEPVGDRTHQVPSAFAKTRADLFKYRVDLPSIACETVVIHAAWVETWRDEAVVERVAIHGFVPFEPRFDRFAGGETIRVMPWEASYQVRIPEGSIFDPSTGVITPGQIDTPGRWTDDAALVIAQAARSAGGYAFVGDDDTSLYAREKTQSVNRWESVEEAEPESIGVRYDTDTRVEGRKSRSRGELPGQLAFGF